MSKDSGFSFRPQIITDPSQLRQTEYQESSTLKHALGSIYRKHNKFGELETYIYGKVGASALSRGLMAAAPVPVSDHKNAALGGAVAAGQVTFTWTTALSTTLSADQYLDGYLLVNDADGEGNIYPIEEHDASTTPTITLAEPLSEALAAASELSFVANKANGVIVIPANPTSAPLGIPKIDLTASYYAWFQTWGVAACLVDSGDVVVEGDLVGTPGTAADDGACGVAAATSNWGRCRVGAAATEFAAIELTLMP